MERSGRTHYTVSSLLAVVNLYVLSLFIEPSVSAVCPDVAPARKHYHLTVYDTVISLPGGQKMDGGFTYNNTYIGPTITAVLGEEISIDVENRASAGDKLSTVLD